MHDPETTTTKKVSLFIFFSSLRIGKKTTKQTKQRNSGSQRLFGWFFFRFCFPSKVNRRRSFFCSCCGVGVGVFLVFRFCCWGSYFLEDGQAGGQRKRDHMLSLVTGGGGGGKGGRRESIGNRQKKRKKEVHRASSDDIILSNIDR